MENFLTLKTFLYLINMPAFACYFIYMKFFLERRTGESKKVFYATLIVSIFYLFFYRFILFEKRIFWSDIYPFFLFFLIIVKYYILNKLLNIKLLAFLLLTSTIYPVLYFLDLILMPYHPYIALIYHLAWSTIFILLSKKLKKFEPS